MSRRHPLCATCGERLRDRANILVEWRTPEHPAVGWHMDCADTDPAWERLSGVHESSIKDDPARLRATLLEIHARGDGRLVANRAFWEAGR